MRGLFARLVIAPEVITELGKPNSQLAHAWDTVIPHLLVNPEDDFVRNLSAALIGELKEGSVLSDRRGFVPKIVSALLRHHAKVAWPVFAGALRDENGKPVYSVISLLSKTGLFGDGGTPLWSLPPVEFRRWAEENRDLLPFFLAEVPLYFQQKTEQQAAGTVDVSTPGDKDATFEDAVPEPEPGMCFAWHPLARVLIDLCGKDEVRDCLFSNLFSFGSTGSRVPYLKKRISLAKDLAKSSHADLKQIAGEIIEALEAEVKREKKFDAHYAAGIHAR